MSSINTGNPALKPKTRNVFVAPELPLPYSLTSILKKILPIQSAKKAGLTFSLHADQPMFESAPLSLIHTAVNRKTRYGKPIGRENKISILEALKAMTIYAARQINMEKKIGSITPGKYADLVILDQNPLKVAPEKLKDIKVKRTIINGCSVFIQ